MFGCVCVCVCLCVCDSLESRLKDAASGGRMRSVAGLGGGDFGSSSSSSSVLILAPAGALSPCVYSVSQQVSRTPAC